MDLTFNKYGITFTLPENCIYYNKNDVCKIINFTPEQKRRCLFVASEPLDKNFVIVSALAKNVDMADYAEMLQEFSAGLTSGGATIVKTEKLVSNDNRIIDYFISTSNGTNLINIFILVDGYLFSCNAMADKNYYNTFNFALNLMKSATF